jgi:hypothetical protein
MPPSPLTSTSVVASGALGVVASPPTMAQP